MMLFIRNMCFVTQIFYGIGWLDSCQGLSPGQTILAKEVIFLSDSHSQETNAEAEIKQALFNDQRMEKQELKFINQFPTLTARGICF